MIHAMIVSRLRIILHHPRHKRDGHISLQPGLFPTPQSPSKFAVAGLLVVALASIDFLNHPQCPKSGTRIILKYWGKVSDLDVM